MRWVYALCLASILLIPATPASADGVGYRTWTDARGRLLRAALVETDGQTVSLKKENGQIATLPIQHLSDADREWLRQIPDSSTPPSAPATPSLPPPAAPAQPPGPEDGHPVATVRFDVYSLNAHDADRLADLWQAKPQAPRNDAADEAHQIFLRQFAASPSRKLLGSVEGTWPSGMGGTPRNHPVGSSSASIAFTPWIGPDGKTAEMLLVVEMKGGKTDPPFRAKAVFFFPREGLQALLLSSDRGARHAVLATYVRAARIAEEESLRIVESSP